MTNKRAKNEQRKFIFTFHSLFALRKLAISKLNFQIFAPEDYMNG
jgi:hypothetical protein